MTHPAAELGHHVVGAASRGDHAAFARIVEHYDDGLRALAYRLLGDRHRMDDVLQEAYVRAFRALPRFRGEARLGTWLYRIVYNACLDELKAASRSRELPLADVADRREVGPGVAEAVVNRSSLAAALAGLAPEDRAAVILVDAQGFDYRSAGRVLGVPEGTVASRLNRARARAAGGPRRRPAGGSRVTYERDYELGIALRKLDVPTHGPGFEESLQRRLRAEQRHGKRRGAGLRWSVAAAAAITAVGALLAIGVPETSHTPRIAGPEVASAAQVQARVREAFASMRSLSGSVVTDGPGADDRRRWSFTATADGDFLLRGPSDDELIAYDAATGTARSAQRSSSAGGDTLFYAIRRGVAPGPPDEGPPVWILSSEYGAYVRALLASDDPRVVAVEHAGLPAWRLDVALTPNTLVPQFSGDELRIVVDRDTGFPVTIIERKQGRVLHELRIDDLVVNPPSDDLAFRPSFPAGAEVSVTDEGFRRVALEDVSAAVGYEPLQPAWVPPGYSLAEVAVADRPVSAPDARGVVSLSYRRGLDQLVVTTRLSSVTEDPLQPPPGLRPTPQPIVLADGALAGEQAELVLAPSVLPHLWAAADGVLLTVAGDLSRAELVHVGESLERR